MKNNDVNEIPVKIRATKSGDEAQNAPSAHTPRRRGRKVVRFFIFILIIAIAALGYAYYTQKKELDLIKNPQAKAEAEKREVASLVEKVSKLILLPSDETPQVFTINDAKTAVKEQPAFSGVVDGDRIMLYTKSNRAVIYSPSRNILVNVIPVTISGTGAPAQQDKDTKTVKDTKSTSTATSSNR